MGLLGDSAPYKCTLNANILEAKWPLCSKVKSKGCGGCGHEESKICRSLIELPSLHLS